MTRKFRVRRDELLKEGLHKATLKYWDEKETRFGERIRWLFEDDEYNVEIAGFTSLSESAKANAYLWATALNEEIRSMSSWGPEDVVGRERILDLTVVEDAEGRKKNKIVRVLPLPKEEQS